MTARKKSLTLVFFKGVTVVSSFQYLFFSINETREAVTKLGVQNTPSLFEAIVNILQTYDILVQ